MAEMMLPWLVPEAKVKLWTPSAPVNSKVIDPLPPLSRVPAVERYTAPVSAGWLTVIVTSMKDPGLSLRRPELMVGSVMFTETPEVV